jgi:hypothetical protein
MGAERLDIANRVRHEEAPAEHLGDILFYDRLDTFLALAPEDGRELQGDRPAERVVVFGLGGEKGRDNRTAVYLVAAWLRY